MRTLWAVVGLAVGIAFAGSGMAQDAGQDGPASSECPTDWALCPDYQPDPDEPEVVVVTGSRIPAPTITNNQETGVDEGDIVKLSGDTLIILRRGRLFTVDIADGALRPVDSIEAYPSGIDAEDDWYDEMLVADGWVVVVGFSYERDTTEINRFRVDRRGRLTFVDSHRLTADDYYSNRNYASRMVGEQLVIYSPMTVEEGDDPLASVPRLSRWTSAGRVQARPLLDTGDVQRVPSLIDGQPPAVQAVHTVISCDMTARLFACDATAIIGPQWRSFYVSANAAYLWLSQAFLDEDDEMVAGGSALLRIGFDGSPLMGTRAIGFPEDQLGFAESPDEGLLRVVILANSVEASDWGLREEQLAAALLTLPLSRFQEGLPAAQQEDYRILPNLPLNVSRWQIRMSETHAIYGYSGDVSPWDMQATTIYAVPFDGGPFSSWLVAGEIERIELMGRDALAVARTSEGVAFHTINIFDESPRDRWDDHPPAISDTFVLEDAYGAETRSHAFYYQPLPESADGEFGLLGLPVMQEAEDNDLYYRAADMAFLRRGDDQLALLGMLESRPEAVEDDGCVASCIDWYGDARPIFIGDRIFALLGYELVEGRPEGRAIREINRVSFAPRGVGED